MNMGRADSGRDDDLSSSSESPESIHTGDELPSSDGFDCLRLRPLPLQIRRPSSEGDPPLRPKRDAGRNSTTPSEREDSDSEGFSYVGSTDGQSEDSHAATLSGDELAKEVSQYLQHSMLEAVYGDTLSCSRTQRYEPKWPMDLEQAEPPLHQPASQGEANRIFRQLFQPLHGWHKLPETMNKAWDARARLQHITSILIEHRQLRNTKPLPPEKRFGNFLLYRNLPDAAIEVNVWSSINSAHVAIRRGQWHMADRRITRAVLLASKLRYEPLIAKCWYWRGLVADALGDRRTATDCFLSAMHCVGVYQEGELMSSEVEKYKDDLLKALKEQASDKTGGDEWSQLVERAIKGIEPWFRPARDLPPPISFGSSIATTEELSSKDIREKNETYHDSSLESQSSSEVQVDGFLQQPTGTHELVWYDERSMRPREIDWILANKIGLEAQNSGYVQKEKIYELCHGFSPSFENIIQGETFTEGFDNYPDLEGSIAWKVLKYGRTKLLRREPSQRGSLSQNVSRAFTSGLTEHKAESLAESSTQNGVVVVEQCDGGPPGAIHKDLPTNTNISSTNIPNVSMVGQIDRVNPSAEEKIAACEQLLLNDEHFEQQAKSARRLELESTDEWRQDIEDQRARFDYFVQAEMAECGIELDHARKRVKQKNRDFLLEIWGPEGTRPPTPIPTKKAREEKRRAWYEPCLRRFQAELTWLTYRQKYRTYVRLPTERRERTMEPIRPSSAIAWLEQEHERTVVSRDGPARSSILTASSDDDQASGCTPTVGFDSPPEGMRDSADSPNHVAIIAPLRLHQRPLQTSDNRVDDDNRPDYNDIAHGSAGSNPSDISSKAQSDINRRLGERGSREIIGQVSINAMTDAMEQARLKDEELTTEQLAQIADAAISSILVAGSSPDIRPASDIDNDDDDNYSDDNHDSDAAHKHTSATEPLASELAIDPNDPGDGNWEDEDDGQDASLWPPKLNVSKSQAHGDQYYHTTHGIGTFSNTNTETRNGASNSSTIPAPAGQITVRRSDPAARADALQHQIADLDSQDDYDVGEGCDDEDWEDEEGEVVEEEEEEEETW